MFTLSSYSFSYISITLPHCGESNLPTIAKNTFYQRGTSGRQLNTHLLPKNLLEKAMSTASLRGDH
jgi:hypothetical protein